MSVKCSPFFLYYINNIRANYSKTIESLLLKIYLKPMKCFFFKCLLADKIPERLKS